MSDTTPQGPLARVFAPTWAGAWSLYRWTFAITGALTLGPRFFGIGDVYGVQDMVFSQRPFKLADTWILTESTATLVWGLGMLGLVLLAVGGRLAKPGVLLYLAMDWLLLANEALNIKAYDRLQLWMAVALLLGPISERGLTKKWRSPYGRYFLVLAFCGIYGSTGWVKPLYEWDGWLSGDVLSYHLLHRHFGLKDIGVWMSTQTWLTAPMGWTTILFEASFPLLVWFRRTNPWALLVGFLMHMGIFTVMNVGPFSFLAVAAYPVLLHPEVARSLYGRFAARLGRSVAAD